MIHRKRATETVRWEERQAEWRVIDRRWGRNHRFQPEAKYFILHLEKVHVTIFFPLTGAPAVTGTLLWCKHEDQITRFALLIFHP